MMWPFTRKPKPINPGPINEDWQYGDLAESLHGRWVNRSGRRPSLEKGDVVKVLSVDCADTWYGPAWRLEIGGFPGRMFDASGFRKVPPLNSEASASFTAQIRACRKTPEEV